MSSRTNGKVRYAVIGLGNIAQVAVLPAFAHARENCELVALASSDREKLRALSRKYDVSLTGNYDELDSLLTEGDIDAAYIAVPNHLHRTMTERVANAGVHVLCEKPMALTSRDCEAMIAVARKNRVKLMIAYRLHFERANLEAINRIEQGEIGEPRIFSSVFCHQVRPGDIRTRGEAGGGALFDLGIYCVNAARYLFKAEPERISAEQFIGTDARFSDVDEMTTAILRFSGGRVAQVTASQGAADVSEYRIVGTKGDLRLDPAYGYVDKLKEFVTLDGSTKKHTFPKSDQFAPELVYFSRCVLDNVEPEPSGEEGLADVRTLEAIVDSFKSHKAVELPPFSRASRPSLEQQKRKPPTSKVRTVHAPSPSK